MHRPPFAATGQYRYVEIGHPDYCDFPYAVICPDGTVYNRYTHRAIADQAADRLNNEDRAARAMTDTDKIAAIAFHLGSFDITRHPRTVEEYEAILDTVRALVLETPR
jgi:hypothetical protein